jgi:hypothetical protein
MEGGTSTMNKELDALKDERCPLCGAKLVYDSEHYGYTCPNHIPGQLLNYSTYLGCRFAWITREYLEIAVKR